MTSSFQQRLATKHGLTTIKRVGSGDVERMFRAKLPEGMSVNIKRFVDIELNDLDRRRFEQELAILVTIDHPAILRTYDGGVDEDGHPYFITATAEGRTLWRVIRDRRQADELFSPEEASLYLGPIASALDYLRDEKKLWLLTPLVSAGSIMVSPESVVARCPERRSVLIECAVRTTDSSEDNAQSAPAAAQREMGMLAAEMLGFDETRIVDGHLRVGAGHGADGQDPEGRKVARQAINDALTNSFSTVTEFIDSLVAQPQEGTSKGEAPASGTADSGADIAAGVSATGPAGAAGSAAEAQAAGDALGVTSSGATSSGLTLGGSTPYQRSGFAPDVVPASLGVGAGLAGVGGALAAAKGGATDTTAATNATDTTAATHAPGTGDTGDTADTTAASVAASDNPWEAARAKYGLPEDGDPAEEPASDVDAGAGLADAPEGTANAPEGTVSTPQGAGDAVELAGNAPEGTVGTVGTAEYDDVVPYIAWREPEQWPPVAAAEEGSVGSEGFAAGAPAEEPSTGLDPALGLGAAGAVGAGIAGAGAADAFASEPDFDSAPTAAFPKTEEEFKERKPWHLPLAILLGIIAAILAVLVAIQLFNLLLKQPWEGSQAGIAEAFPEVLPESSSGSGPGGSQCYPAYTDDGLQTIECDGSTNTYSFIDYGSRDARAAILEDEGVDVKGDDVWAEDRCEDTPIIELGADEEGLEQYLVLSDNSRGRYGILVTGDIDTAENELSTC